MRRDGEWRRGGGTERVVIKKYVVVVDVIVLPSNITHVVLCALFFFFFSQGVLVGEFLLWRGYDETDRLRHRRGLKKDTRKKGSVPS